MLVAPCLVSSPWPLRPTSLATTRLAKTVIALVDDVVHHVSHVCLQGAILHGHSMGGPGQEKDRATEPLRAPGNPWPKQDRRGVEEGWRERNDSHVDSLITLRKWDARTPERRVGSLYDPWMATFTWHQPARWSSQSASLKRVQLTALWNEDGDR